jgi:D-serine deaminase-like pyridoxal phosphate-dependent protein
VNLRDLRTPSVLIDKPRFERNVDRMQAAAKARGIGLRPHAKTHKSPDLARVQIARGATGICCAKIGEAEVFAAAGIADIRIPYPINPANADRVLTLLDLTRLSFIVDDVDVAGAWSDVMRRSHREVDVLVKVDVGFHRCGIDPERRGAAEVVARVADMPGLRFRGLLSHAGHGYGAGSEDEIAAIAAEEARTPTARFSLQQDGITELRPGNYIYFDRTQVGLGAATWDDCALTVLARVVSRPAADRIILDCGSKTLSTDQARAFGASPGFGVVFADLDTPRPDESLLVERLSEEHATVRVLGAGCALKTGDLVRVLPNPACVVSNLVDSAWLVKGDEVLDELPIAARGRIV